MNEENLTVGAPLDEKAERAQIQRLFGMTKEHLSRSVSGSVPLACRVIGSEVSGYPIETLLPATIRLFFYFENYGKVVSSTWAEFSSFYMQRKPWQDYDVCAFPEKEAWCIALSHNERVVVVGSGAPVRLAPNNSLQTRRP